MVAWNTSEGSNRRASEKFRALFQYAQGCVTSFSWDSWVPTAAISCALASGCIQTVTWVPRSSVPVALADPWRSSSAAPTSDSDTATVRTAAIVMRRLRHRFDAVSRTT